MESRQERSNCSTGMGGRKHGDLVDYAFMPRMIWIGLAGFAGTLLRYWLSGAVAKRYGETFPYGTLAVNAFGCLLAGALFYLMYERFLTSPTVRSMVFIGLLGGFTTFSSYGLQTFTLLRDGELLLGLINIAASNVAGLFLVWIGYRLAGLV
jgi:CrcB protein